MTTTTSNVDRPEKVLAESERAIVCDVDDQTNGIVISQIHAAKSVSERAQTRNKR